jgi:hypothetical protein
MVMINHEKKIIFMEIPKNASTSIRKLLYCNGFVQLNIFDKKTKKLHHETIHDLKSCEKYEDIKHYKKVAIIRDPETRIKSILKMFHITIKTININEDILKKYIWSTPQIEYIDEKTHIINFNNFCDSIDEVIPDLDFPDKMFHLLNSSNIHINPSEQTISTMKKFYTTDYDLYNKVNNAKTYCCNIQDII